METKEAIKAIISALDDVKATGQETVNISALEKYLSELAVDANESIEMRKLEYQRTLSYYDAQTKHNIELFKSVIESGKEALNALVLINGGAVVALLGFLGAAISKGFTPSLGLGLTKPLAYFGFGVLLGALAFGARYVSQTGYAHQKTRFSIPFHVLAVVLAVAGYSVFASGLYLTYLALAKQFMP